MKKILLFVAAIVGIALLGWFIVMGVENGAIDREQAIEKVDGNIRTQEKRRFDLIPNLVECVKQYDEHEYRTLRDVIAARTGEGGEGTEMNINEIKAVIKAVAEAYPDLKAQKNYQNLTDELANTENKISQYRMEHNSMVQSYANYTRKFPTKQILGMRGYQVKDYKMLEFENTSVDAPNVSDIFGNRE